MTPVDLVVWTLHGTHLIHCTLWPYSAPPSRITTHTSTHTDIRNYHYCYYYYYYYYYYYTTTTSIFISYHIILQYLSRRGASIRKIAAP